MSYQEYHRGFGLNTNTIDANIANTLVNQGRELILNANLGKVCGSLTRTLVDIPLRGRLSPAEVYARFVIRTGEKADQKVILVLADHSEKPFIQLTSLHENKTFTRDTEIIKTLFNELIDFQTHKFSKVPRDYNNEHVQHFSNESLEDFTSDVRPSSGGRKQISNHCLIADVNRKIFDNFNYSNIKENFNIESIAIGTGYDFENPYPHKGMLEAYSLYINIESIADIQKDITKYKLGAIAGHIFKSKKIDALQNNLLGLLDKYRMKDTVTAYGRKPMGSSDPYIMSPQTDLKKMINKIIANTSNWEVKGTKDDDTQVIVGMYKGLIRGDETHKKYAMQIKDVAKEIRSELSSGTLKTFLGYSIAKMR